MLRVWLISMTLAAAPALAHAADLIGSRFGLEGWFQETPGHSVVRVAVPTRATVENAGVEFPQVSRLFDTPEARRAIAQGRLHRFVNTWIDIGPNWIEVDFRRAGAGQFTPAHRNTYVFVFDQRSPIALSNARIDRARTTLPIGQARLRADGNRLHLNVQGLNYNAGSFVRIVFDVDPVLGGGTGTPPAAAQPPRPSAAPEISPEPAEPPGLSTFSSG
ncbi:MAG: hypothetical protein AAF674_10270 [Pseudomonadota bacterium]